MISLIMNITDKAKEFIRRDEVEGVIEIKSRYAGLDSIILPVPKDEDATDDIFTMSKLNMHNISFLQYSILYGAKKCFNYFINMADKDHIDSGSHSLHIATTRLDIYYIDQLLKKWGDNDIWINIRNTRNGYSGLMNALIHDDIEFTSPFFNEAERTLEEVQELKIKITEIFTSYPSLNVLLEDIRRTVVFDVLENNPSDNTIKNILTTHKSMGELQNIGLRVSERRGIPLTRAELSRGIVNIMNFE